MSDKNKFDYSHFTVKSVVDTKVPEVYKLWTTKAGLEKWFLRLAEFVKEDGSFRQPDEDIQEGDTYRWLWHGYPDNVVEHGKILELNGKNHLRFSFGKAGIVTVTIGVEENTTIVTLTQEDIPPVEESEINYHVECKTGWTFYLANMNSIVQGGVDLRNKNQKLNLD
ncbi:SRPBCC domain-containing protein [Mangrovivirga sp. M17]|uniref:SRPBCC domain-containing protein n=1 Tax=Mangrovivirga halotolerans TaxID=2993936 RepID=A0ABT3RNA6_9BACT|nr:SRPBCC domain-containing protein [Mangrovivirga halotolerans]MCX2743291.1 SRPBCC domain-containing protein [Mangrovivirga halotolerans]